MSVEEWAEARCENSVRVNGCPDDAPYHSMPWAEGPDFAMFTHEWCHHCTKEDPRTTITDDEDVVWDLSDNEHTELDEVYASEIDAIDDALVTEDQIKDHRADQRHEYDAGR